MTAYTETACTDPNITYTRVQLVVAGEVYAPASLYQISEGSTIIGYTLKLAPKRWIAAQHAGDLHYGAATSFCCTTRKAAALVLSCCGNPQGTAL